MNKAEIMKPGTKVERDTRYFNWNILWRDDITDKGEVIWWHWPLCKIQWRRWKQFSGGLIWWKEIHFTWNVRKSNDR